MRIKNYLYTIKYNIQISRYIFSFIVLTFCCTFLHCGQWPGLPPGVRVDFRPGRGGFLRGVRAAVGSGRREDTSGTAFVRARRILAEMEHRAAVWTHALTRDPVLAARRADTCQALERPCIRMSAVRAMRANCTHARMHVTRIPSARRAPVISRRFRHGVGLRWKVGVGLPRISRDKNGSLGWLDSDTG